MTKAELIDAIAVKANITKKDAETLGPQGRYKFIDVLFEDNYIIMTNKPPFIDFESYVETVKNYLKRKNQKEKSYPYLGQMHRLDKETSGIMAFTKKKVANTLAEQFRDHRIKKFYLALVNGQVQADQGTLNKKLEKGEFAEGKKSRVSDSPEAKRAITEYRVAERYEQATLLNVQILTGRTHQIRVHMSDLGHPIVGDKIYGGETGLPFNRQVLHAERLYFTHPITKKKMRLTAPLPADIQTLVDRLRDGEIVK